MSNILTAAQSKLGIIAAASVLFVLEAGLGIAFYFIYWAYQGLKTYTAAIGLIETLWILAGISTSLLAAGIILFALAKKRQRESVEAHDLIRKLSENQQQSLQSDKLSAIGQLAAGVAHEINNPMTFIMGNISCLGQYFAALRQTLEAFHQAMTEPTHPGDPSGDESRKKALELWASEDIPFLLGDIQKILAESESGGKRIQEIVSNMRLFANLDEAEQKSIDLNQRIDSTLKLASTAFRNRCRIHKKLGNLPPFTCSPGQLNLALLNLLNNAAEAIAIEGDITVESSLVGDEIVLAISDNGCGISPENRTKLFTPFFTTKPPGKGIGLGLSLCHGIVKRLHGSIDVLSEVGKGTTFTLRLPLHSPTAA